MRNRLAVPGYGNSLSVLDHTEEFGQARLSLGGLNLTHMLLQPVVLTILFYQPPTNQVNEVCVKCLRTEPKGRHPLDVRVGADRGTGAGGGVGRRGTLGRNTQGEVVATSAMASPCTAMCAALFCCPFSGGALLPLLRSPSSASDGPSGEAAGMEAHKRRLTLDLASTFQRWLKVWRSRASACAGAVKPPSTGRPTKGGADTPLLGSPMRHSQHAPGAPPRRYGRYAVRPRLRARGFSPNPPKEGVGLAS